MIDNKFKLWNNILGWGVFLVAWVVFTLTLEDTSSFWDCGEYIATSVKLQVGHPPGAPLFQMLGAIVSALAYNVPSLQAWTVNFMSGTFNALTILFMFWSLTIIAKEFLYKGQSVCNFKVFAIGLLGSLTFCFTDTFWFSGVEGEVYAAAQAFLALSFWLGLKWYLDESPQKDRWLMVFFLIMGLGIGIHMLIFLCIPPIGFLYYFRYHNTPMTFKEVLKKKFVLHFAIVNFVIIAILYFIYSSLFPKLLDFINWFEILFVNSFSLPFHSGTIFSFVLIIAFFVWFFKYLKKTEVSIFAKYRKEWYLSINGLMFIFIGYTCWLMLPIRSIAFTPINENKPVDAVSLKSYYNREQYGETENFYGTSYAAYNSADALDEKQPYLDDSPIYGKDEKLGKYVVISDRKGSIPNYKKEYKQFFPRMNRRDGSAINYYKYFVPSIEGKKKPSMWENFIFTFQYQFKYMYLRYLFWNFVGRQNDQQGRLDNFNGNWITGISFIDEDILGLPKSYNPNDKSRNTYFGIPLILGIIGFFYIFKKRPKVAYTLLIFFVMTGLGLVFNSSMKPLEPRERDYVFVTSFYVFAMFIAFSFPAILDYLEKKWSQFKQNSRVVGASVFALLILGSPVLLAVQNWDDHDRSGRTTVLKVSKSYMEPCLPNSILFNMGDNDTFPLWYAQEIEGIRTDMKLINLSLFNTDWYVEAQQRASYDAKPIPSQIKREKYIAGKRDVIYYQDMGIKDTWTIKQLVDWIDSDNSITRRELQSGSVIDIFPVKKIRIPVNKEAVLRNNIVPIEDSALILPYLDITLNTSHLEKKDMMIFDIIANNNWERPIYFAMSIGRSPSTFAFLQEHLQLEGMVYQFVPIKSTGDKLGLGRVNADRLAYNIVNKVDWENFNDSTLYFDETTRSNIFQYKNISLRAVVELAKEKKFKKTYPIFDLVTKNLPYTKDVSFMDYLMVEKMMQTGYKNTETEVRKIKEVLEKNIDYYESLNNKNLKRSDLERSLAIYNGLYELISPKFPAISITMKSRLDKYNQE